MSKDLINENEQKPEEAKALDISKKGIDLFFGEKERKFFESVGKEMVIDILKQSFILYRVDIKRTKTHELYGEAKKKAYLPPVEVFGRINVESKEPEYMSKGGIIQKGFGTITASVYKSHLDELGAEIKLGDFLYHKGHYYETTDDGSSNISNQHAFGGDKLFSLTIKGVRVKDDVFKAR